MICQRNPRVLITSGPTREYLDPVRFLSNGSSGRMGAALAAAVLKRGGTPVVVSGPVTIAYPDGCEVYWVETTEQMLQECRRHFAECVGVIGAAAPCDYRPEHFSEQKLKKSNQGGVLTLRLVETPDILTDLDRTKRPDQWSISFALETENCKEYALKKLQEKNCDFVVLNFPDSINNDLAKMQVFDARGECRLRLECSKSVIAEQLIELAAIGSW